MPVIEELLYELARSKWFTNLDVKAGYHQIRMARDDVSKTTFKTHLGHYEFKVMTYGLSYAPGTFQGVMCFVLASLLRHGVLVFIDDILVHNETSEEHVRLLRQVFELQEKHQLEVKMSKCKFAQQKFTYLGHMVSGDGVAIDAKNIAAVRD